MSSPVPKVQSATLPGLHHVTAFCKDPQENYDFYTGVLGMRLIKVTVNFDDPGMYHLYYGDGLGSPGTALTFFPLGPRSRGRAGVGQTSSTRLAVPSGSLSWWTDRLALAGVPTTDPEALFGESSLRFQDPDGMTLELVETPWATSMPGWPEGPIPQDKAIRGFHSILLNSEDPEASRRHLVQNMGFSLVEEGAQLHRFAALGAEHGSFADLLLSPEGAMGAMGSGTVHHVAWRAPSLEDQDVWRSRLMAGGAQVTTVRNRCYFQSIYSYEPGGVLYEIATDGPGFDADEPVSALGSELRLPPWLESRREIIRTRLPEFRTSEGVQFP